VKKNLQSVWGGWQLWEECNREIAKQQDGSIEIDPLFQEEAKGPTSGQGKKNSITKGSISK